MAPKTVRMPRAWAITWGHVGVRGLWHHWGHADLSGLCCLWGHDDIQYWTAAKGYSCVHSLAVASVWVDFHDSCYHWGYPGSSQSPDIILMSMVYATARALPNLQAYSATGDMVMSRSEQLLRAISGSMLLLQLASVLSTSRVHMNYLCWASPNFHWP